MKAFKDYEILDEENDLYRDTIEMHKLDSKMATTPHFQMNQLQSANDANKAMD